MGCEAESRGLACASVGATAAARRSRDVWGPPFTAAPAGRSAPAQASGRGREGRAGWPCRRRLAGLAAPLGWLARPAQAPCVQPPFACSRGPGAPAGAKGSAGCGVVQWALARGAGLRA